MNSPSFYPTDKQSAAEPVNTGKFYHKSEIKTYAFLNLPADNENSDDPG
jgi:hypothetical protein